MADSWVRYRLTMNTRTRTGVQPPSRPWPLLLFFGLAGAAIAQEEPVSPPGPPAQRAETVALCEALAGPAPDAKRVRVLLAQGADPDTICVVTTTIKVPTEPRPSLLGNLAHNTLTGGRPSLGKALVGLLMLPLLPVLGLMGGLNRALVPGFRWQTVDAHLPPLHLAAQADASACALVLLEAGAELERQDEDGLTPLAYALVHAEQQGTSETLPLLLERGASLKALEPYNARGLAAIALQPALLSLLCAHGLDPNASPRGRPTALVLTIEDGHAAATRGLLACGASPEPRQRADRFPVDAARRANRPSLLDLLVEHGASLETEDEGGAAPSPARWTTGPRSGCRCCWSAGSCWTTPTCPVTPRCTTPWTAPTPCRSSCCWRPGPTPKWRTPSARAPWRWRCGTTSSTAPRSCSITGPRSMKGWGAGSSEPARRRPRASTGVPWTCGRPRPCCC